jgi:hypothetical protein
MAEINNQLFLKAIEEHERTWGTETYLRRPSLFQIMSSPVVVFWETPADKKHLTITLHQNLQDIEKHFLRILVARDKKAPQKRITYVFENQEKVVIKGVRIVFGKSREPQSK